MPGNRVRRVQCDQGVDRRQPAKGLAVDHRHVACEQQIAGPEGFRAQIEDRQILIRVRCRPRLQVEYAVAKVELPFTVDQQRRHRDLAAGSLCTEQPVECLTVALASGGQCRRKPGVGHEHCCVADKGRIAERVVGMDVGMDDVADRLVGALAQRGEQGGADCLGAAGIDDRYTAAADNEADVGDVTAVVGGGRRHRTAMDVDAVCRVLQRQRRFARNVRIDGDRQRAQQQGQQRTNQHCGRQ